VHTAEEAGEPARMLRSAIDVNHRQRRILADKIAAHFNGELRGRTIALWGLAFKANTDDMREAPSLSLIEALTAAGAQVRAYDPIAIDNARSLLAHTTGVTFAKSAHDACEGADALAVVTEWLEFRSPDFGWLAQTLKARALFDGRNLYNPAAVRAAGLNYYGIGRGNARKGVG
ncbi:MAG TPA: UDP binding domain-containing protein, partial [Burkholderiaceae bacterium]|nr:UDP binding domain-containing protein [Burkholderiaceae bacterium]